MNNITRRLSKAENALRIEEPHIVNIAGYEIMSDDLDELIRDIGAEGKGLPIKEGTTV